MTSRTPALDHTGWLRSTLGVAIASAWMMPGVGRAQTTGDDATADRIPGHPETLTVIGHHQGYQELDPHLDRITTRLVDTPQTITEIPKQLLQDQNITSVVPRQSEPRRQRQSAPHPPVEPFWAG